MPCSKNNVEVGPNTNSVSTEECGQGSDSTLEYLLLFWLKKKHNLPRISVQKKVKQ